MSARASLAYGDFKLDLEGSEQFVGVQLDHWSTKIGTITPAPNSQAQTEAGSSEAPAEDSSDGGEDSGGVASAAEKKPRRTTSKGGPSCASRIRTLKEDGFFATPRKSTEISDRLKEKATPYEGKHISAALIHTVKVGQLRRVKSDGVWTYVNP